MCVWDDPTVNWDRFDLVLVRSTSDYTLRRAELLAWAALPSNRQPHSVLPWNIHKGYLHDLEQAGVPVPTVFLNPGERYRMLHHTPATRTRWRHRRQADRRRQRSGHRALLHH